MKNQIRTFTLLAALSGVLLAAGYFFGGTTGLTIALAIAVAMNFGSYWWSHKIVLKMYNAQPASKEEYSELHQIVDDIVEKAQIPKPDLYIIPTEHANAFATGRNPENAAVACTQGLIELLDKDELEGVLAHEISHVKNRDTLVNAVAATIAAVISYIAIIARWSAIFGGMSRDGNNNILELLVLGILTPIIATMIKLAISRSREYLADKTGAGLTGKPKHLASALKKIDSAGEQKPLRKQSTTQSTAHMFISNPFKKGRIIQLFSTHPPTEKRVEQLDKMQT